MLAWSFYFHNARTERTLIRGGGKRRGAEQRNGKERRGEERRRAEPRDPGEGEEAGAYRSDRSQATFPPSKPAGANMVAKEYKDHQAHPTHPHTIRYSRYAYKTGH